MSSVDWKAETLYVARCPKHGLHGQRTTCFDCGGPVEQVPMVPVQTVAKAWRALERQRDRWMSHAIDAGLKVYELRRELADARRLISDRLISDRTSLACYTKLLRDAFA